MMSEIFEGFIPQNMQEYGFSLFPFKDRILDSLLLWENTGQRKPVF